MENLKAFLDKIDNMEHRLILEDLFQWILDHYPNLTTDIKWNQPMFIDHGTFIVGFSVSKKHLAFTPEKQCLQHFKSEIEARGLDHTENIVRFDWNKPIDRDLLKLFIDFNLEDKKDVTTFWRT